MRCIAVQPCPPLPATGLVGPDSTASYILILHSAMTSDIVTS